MNDGVRYLLPLILGSAILGLVLLALAAYRQIRPLPQPDDYETKYGRLSEEQMHDFIRRYP